MADINAILNAKQNGIYNRINLKTKSEIVDFDKTGTEMVSVDVGGAIKEVFGKAKDSLQKNQVVNTMEVVLSTEEDSVPCGTKPVKELFQSVSSGKAIVASAITDKGVPTESDATFQVMATNVSKIYTQPNSIRINVSVQCGGNDNANGIGGASIPNIGYKKARGSWTVSGGNNPYGHLRINGSDCNNAVVDITSATSLNISYSVNTDSLSGTGSGWVDLYI